MCTRTSLLIGNSGAAKREGVATVNALLELMQRKEGAIVRTALSIRLHAVYGHNQITEVYFLASAIKYGGRMVRVDQSVPAILLNFESNY
jgi:hypothetical protein